MYHKTVISWRIPYGKSITEQIQETLGVSPLSRPIMLHGRESTEEEIFRYILELIDNGITGTTALSKEIGKDKRTVRRYLVRMSKMGKITLDPHSGRLEHTIVPPIEYQHITTRTSQVYPDTRDLTVDKKMHGQRCRV